MYNTYYKS